MQQIEMCKTLTKWFKWKKNNFFVSLLTAISFLAVSCEGTTAERNFFKGRNHYSSKEFDSLQLIKNLEIATDGVKINGNYYWKINTSPESFFRIHGFIRLSNDSIVLKSMGPENPCTEIQDQLLFSFNRKDLNQKWFTRYTCESPMIIGDSISLIDINYDTTLSDSLYTFKMKGYFLSAKSNSQQPTDCIKIINVSKEVGFVRGCLTNGIDSIEIQFYPDLKRLNDGYFGKSGTFNL